MKSYKQNQMPEDGGERMEGKGVGGGGTSQKLNKDDAKKYLNEVKEILQDQKEKYSMFLKILKDFICRRTDVDGVIDQVKELLKDHKNLIYGFNVFLPKGYEISPDVNEHPPKQNVELDKFVNKVKKRFQNDESDYKSFLDMMNMYRNDPKDIEDVYKKATVVFQNHQDLFEEFASFLCGPPPADYFDQDDIRRDLSQYNFETRDVEGLASSDDKPTLGESIHKFCENVQERLGDTDYLEFLKYLYYFGIRKMEISDLRIQMTDLLGSYPELMDEFNQIIRPLEDTESDSGDETDGD